MYRRRTTTRRPAYPATYRKRRQPAKLKPAQTRYERRQPTAVTKRSASQAQLYRTPLWPASKLIHDQFYYDYGRILTSLAGTTETRVYIANGVYDPDITGTGHQAIGFDQIMLAYEHYATIRSKITVTFVNNSDYPVRCGLYLSPDATALTAPEQIMENGLVKSIVCDAKGTNGTGQRVYSLTMDCDVKKYFGKGKYNQLLEEKYSGTVAANPTEAVYYNVFAYSAHTGTSSMQVLFDCIISYDTIYYEPRKLVTS